MALNSIRGMGTRPFYILKEKYSFPGDIFLASYDDLISVSGIGPKLAMAIKTFDVKRFILREEKLLEKSGTHVITLLDDDYPEQLKEISDPPYILYVKGNIKKDDTHLFSVVGARKPTPYGKTAVLTLIPQLARAGFTIVSGMARGIDSLAHKSALITQGKTIAVLGCGIDVTYPPENKILKDDISKSGAVISEFSMATRPDKMNFPRRNRIISGLSFGTLVVEATSNSGSLITAQFALDQGREVFAVPGNITSQRSQGCHKLIKSGAKLVEGISDIIDEMPYHLKKKTKKISFDSPADSLDNVSLSNEEKNLLSLFHSKETHIDELIKMSALKPAQLLPLLTKLEILGVIKQLSGKFFIKMV